MIQIIEPTYQEDTSLDGWLLPFPDERAERISAGVSLQIKKEEKLQLSDQFYSRKMCVEEGRKCCELFDSKECSPFQMKLGRKQFFRGFELDRFLVLLGRRPAVVELSP